MDARKSAAALAAAALILLACANEEPAETPVGGWEFDAPPYPGVWTGCALQSDGTLWASVLREPSSQPAIARYRNGSWTIANLPADEIDNLHDIIVFDDNSGWAAGNRSNLIRLRAGAWEPTTVYTNVEYYYLAGTDGSHVWVNGITRPYGIPEPLVLFFDGRIWNEEIKLTGYVSYGPMVALSGEEVLMIARRDEGDEIIRMTHGAWGYYYRPEQRYTFYRLTAAEDHVYAVGQQRNMTINEGAVLQIAPERRNLTPPADIADPTLYYYYAALALGPDNLWVGAAPYSLSGDHILLHWDGLRWKRAPLANRTENAARVFEFAFDEAGRGWAVGGNGVGRYVAP